LKAFTGALHADGYAGFNGLYQGDCVVEAARWAHVRRKFFDVHAANGSEIAREALDRIGALYGIEATINGLSADERRRQRQTQSRPIKDALKAWAQETCPKLSARSELAAAFRYMLARWLALTRCIDDGRLALDNNPAERALRGVAIGMKNYLFAGSDRGGERAAAMYSMINCQAQRHRSRDLSARCPYAHCRSSDQPHRQSAALELAARPRCQSGLRPVTERLRSGFDPAPRKLAVLESP
jgi:hypothetical protein